MAVDDENELRSKLGDKKTDELMELVRKLKAQGKSPDEITIIVRRKFKGLTIFRLPSIKMIMR